MTVSRNLSCRELMVLFALILASRLVLAGSDAHVITAPEALDRVESGELLMVDVRSAAEWRKTGIPEPAIPVTIHQPGGPSAFYEAIMEAVGDKDRSIAVICATGRRSGVARRILTEGGFTAVFDVSEGMLGNSSEPGWIARGLPTKSCDDCR